jgi:hypothetical protein
VVDAAFKGVVRVCTDPDEPLEGWTSCGSRGPARIAEVNTFDLTLARPEKDLSVGCGLTVENNSRYLIPRKGEEYFIIAASDVAADLMGVHVRHVSKLTMFPLGESLYKIDQKIKQRDAFRGRR